MKCKHQIAAVIIKQVILLNHSLFARGPIHSLVPWPVIAPWNFCPMELLLPGANVLRNFAFTPGTFAPVWLKNRF